MLRLALTLEEYQKFSQNIQPINTGVLTDPNPLLSIIWNIVAGLFVIAIYGFLLAMLIGGVQYLFSEGNEEGITKAKKTFINSVIGIIVVSLSYQILNFLLHQFGPYLQTDTLNIASIIGRIYEVLTVFSGAFFLIFLLEGGFRYLTAAGNEESVGKAKKTMTTAIVGLLLVVFAFAIGRLLLKLLEIF